MMLFLIFLFVDLSVVGIFYAVYGRRRTYSEGMLMGVHLPESAASGEEVGRMMEQYHVRTKKFYLWNLAAVILMGGLCFWRESVFVIVWTVWLLEMCIGAFLLLYRTHRKLYDLKVERGWIGSTGSRIMAADTRTAAQPAEPGDRPCYIDDDVYWKNGWYSNPNDKRVFVQDWACSANYTVNLGRPAGKAWMAAGLAVTAACLIWLCVEMAKLDFVPIRMEVQEDGISITSGYTDLALSCDEILDVELINALPEDNYRRTNGVSDGRHRIGKFRGRETGKCRMFLYTEYAPILEIDIADGPVYINSETDGEAEEWYDELLSFCPE